jgi:hypothetical protein
VWTQTLTDAGVEVRAVDAHHAMLSWQGHSTTVPVTSTRRPVPPEPGGRLVIHSHPSVATRERYRQAGWSLVTADGTGWIRFADGTVLELSGPPAPRTPTAARGRPGWSVWTLTRLLLAQPQPATQTALAEAAGLTQPRVSQLLRRLATQNLVSRTDTGWAPTDWDALCDWWISGYPGPAGMVTHWYGLQPPAQQLTKVLGLLAQSDPTKADGSGRLPAVSGDLAADLLAAWRRPTQLIVYASTGVDLTAVGLVTAADPTLATTVLVVPEDPAITLSPAADPQLQPSVEPIRYADSIQILYDLTRSPGPDAGEATRHFRQWLKSRSLP